MWRAITPDDIRLQPVEIATLNAISGAADICQDILLGVVREFDAAGRTGGNDTPGDDTVADLCRPHVIARTRWLWLCEFPQMKSFQTPGREKLNRDAVDFINLVSTQKQNIDVLNGTAPTTPAGNWNSENRIILRTHPAPPASQQFPPQPGQPGYANPDGPADL